MTLKINDARFSITNPPEIPEKFKLGQLQTNTTAENERAIKFLANNGGTNPSNVSNREKTPLDFLREVLTGQPVNIDDQNKSKVNLVMKLDKSPQTTTRDDYNLAFRRAVYNKAMDGLKLTDEEIRLADKALIDAGLYKTYYNLQGALDVLKADQQKIGNQMPVSVGKENIEYARRAGQAILQYQNYKAQRVDLAVESGKTYVNEAIGGFVQPIVNAPINIVNGLSEPFRAGERGVFGTRYIPEIPKMTVAERSEYWNKDGRMYANKGGEIAATIAFGGVFGGRAIATQTGRTLIGLESVYNIGAGIAGKDITQTDTQGNARQMEWMERGLRITGGLFGARQAVKTEILTPNSLTNKAADKLDDIFKNPPNFKPQAELITPEGVRLKISENTFEKPSQSADDLNVKMSAKYNPAKRTDAELTTDLNPSARTGETALDAQKRVQYAQGEIEARQVSKIYDQLGDKPPKIDIDENDAKFSSFGAHTQDRHGYEIDLLRDPFKKTIEGRIYGDTGWGNAQNYSYKWKEGTVNRTIKEYLQNNWEQVRTDLALNGKHTASFDAGKSVGEGFFNKNQMGFGSPDAAYHQTSSVKIVFRLVPGSDPAEFYVHTSFPNGSGK